MHKTHSYVLILITFAVSACGLADNRFCISSGHLYGTHNYYECTERYDEDPEAFDHCMLTFGHTSETIAQKECVAITIPAIRKTFANDTKLCTTKAELANYHQSMHPLPSVRIFTYNTKKYVTNESIHPHYTNVKEIINKHRRNYIRHCLTEKGWQKHFRFLEYDFDGLHWEYTHD